MARAQSDPANATSAAVGRTAAAKIGLRSGSRLAFVAAPQDWLPGGLPDEVELVGEPREADVVIFFARAQVELAARVSTLAEAIFPDRALWVAWPRRAGGHASDLTDTSVRSTLITIGLVDNKVAALDTDWSALRFVWPRAARPKATRPR